MITVARGQVLSGGSSPLDVFVASGGMLTDVYSIAFAMFSAGGDQIFPPGGRQTVDVAGVNHIGTGHYCAAFTVPSDATIGAAEVRWYYRLTAGGAEFSMAVPCAVSATLLTSRPAYCTVADLRAEGVTDGTADDIRLALAITRASSFIEQVTGRWFEPRRMVFTLDGTNAAWLPIPAPIIAIESVIMTFDSNFTDVPVVDPAAYLVYARHLTDGIISPDDRQNPKLQIRDAATLARLGFDIWNWIRGHRNIQVTGVFGYTDPDGSPMGKTPDLLKWACMSLAIKYAMKLGTGGGRMPGQGGAIKSEQTRDQSVEYATSSVAPGGTITGDSEIDMILESYRRPMLIEAV